MNFIKYARPDVKNHRRKNIVAVIDGLVKNYPIIRTSFFRRNDKFFFYNACRKRTNMYIALDLYVGRIIYVDL